MFYVWVNFLNGNIIHQLMAPQYGAIIQNLADFLQLKISDMKLIQLHQERDVEAVYIQFLNQNKRKDFATGIRYKSTDIDGNSVDKIMSISFYNPYSAPSPYAPFSLKTEEEMWIERVSFSYDFVSHPELRNLLERTIANKRIPAEILKNGELSVLALQKPAIGIVKHNFGKTNEKLCLQVDYMNGLERLVPEAKEQPDQDHYCIHGESAPFMPFNVQEFGQIGFEVESDGTDDRKYLEQILQNVIVPSEYFSMNVNFKEKTIVVIGTDLFSDSLKISLYDPENPENWTRALKITKDLERMFRA